MPPPSFPPQALELPIKLSEVILTAALTMLAQTPRAFRRGARRRGGRTLRPGADTPLWNDLRAQLRRQLRRRGSQVNLGRVLGLPRQRINGFVTRGREMPDAERTLQLLVWLLAVRAGRPPA